MKPQQQHGCVPADIFGAQILVRGRGDGLQRLAGLQLNVQHALQGGGQDGGRDSLAGDIHQRDVQHIFAGDNIEEVAADRTARHAVRLHIGEGKSGDLDGHQSLLDLRGDLQLLLVLSRLVFDGGELRIFDQGRGFARNRSHQLVVHFGDALRLEAAFEIEHAEYLARVEEKQNSKASEKDTRREARVAACMEEMVLALRAASSPVTSRAQIVGLVKGDTNVRQAGLARLLADGRVVCHAGKYEAALQPDV